MIPLKIFGYGSLINRQSLLNTSPDATDIKVANVKGFKRSFNLWDEKGLTAKSHGPLRGQPYCALDVEESNGDDVNGLVFTIMDSLEAIKEREYMYRLVETEAFDFESGLALGKVCVFSAGRTDGSYAMDSPAQARYLGMCLAGTKACGRDFYEKFLSTTYIGGKVLSDFSELLESSNHYVDNLN